MQTEASLRSGLLKAREQLPYLWRALVLIWEATPGWTAGWAALLVVQGILPVAIVNLTRLLVDSLVTVMDTGPEGESFAWESVRPVMIQVGLMAAVLILKEILRSVVSLIRTAQSERIKDHMNGLIHQKSVEVDLAFYDSPGYHDQLYRARFGASQRPLALLESTGVLLQNGITLVAMLFVLLPYGPWLPLALLVSTLPAFYVVLKQRLQLHRWTIKNTESERRAAYYDWMLTVRESAAELRLFQLSEYFRNLYQILRKRLRQERIQLAVQQGRAEVLAGGVTLLVTGAAMAWMVWRAVNGQVSLGDLALFYQAFNQGQGLMRSFLENAGEIYSNSFFLADLFEFLELQPCVFDPPDPLPVPAVLKQGVQMQGLTFYYPESARPALDGFNLEIKPGRIVAIVGANGAGKSTLIKLLCRFYDPQEGAITIDGVDIRQFALQDLREHITVLFQEPLHFSATAGENIALGDLSILQQTEREESDGIWKQRVREAAQVAGADEPISRLPQGYESLLGRWFKGGTDLSVGEWQRVALARSFLRDAPIIVLDEPTSAMDPWAEADWLVRFRRMAAGRTAILITHRFTTAAFADVIHVMDEGRIVESGQHHELLEQAGAYATSWKEQMHRWLEASSPDEGADLSA
ncbi:MAG: ABC transporter ATP-binding protein [Chloroflexota bacterium]